MKKSQQMRWSRRGADRRLQIRCAVYNGNLDTGLGSASNPPTTITPHCPSQPDPRFRDSPDTAPENMGTRYSMRVNHTARAMPAILWTLARMILMIRHIEVFNIRDKLHGCLSRLSIFQAPATGFNP
jgi:hypothetical protein